MLSPPSAVKKESLSSMDKEGDDSSESGESLVIGESFSPLSNNFRAVLLVCDSRGQVLLLLLLLPLELLDFGVFFNFCLTLRMPNCTRFYMALHG
jgi:hypothetical protein